MNLKVWTKELIAQGVRIPSPFMVDIGEEVRPNRISTKGVVLHPGTRIYGEKTVIAPNVKLSEEGPVIIVNCRLGSGVELKGGYFRESTFLENVSVGSGAQIREACLLEEQVTVGHTVGLKQTILFPFVTLGSMINFCDCLMAGGTCRKNHSEVGSSYIHFNFTPQQDKATPSLIGDVPRGVMLRNSPIFLGGQGGMIGPARIGFGTVTTAGTVLRRDCPEGGKIISEATQNYKRDFVTGCYGDVARRVHNNIIYIANILALREWYRHVRRLFFTTQPTDIDLWSGVMDAINSAVDERISRLQGLSKKMEDSIRLLVGHKHQKKSLLIRRQVQFITQWPEIETALAGGAEKSFGTRQRDRFLKDLEKNVGEFCTSAYIPAIQGLKEEACTMGTSWLNEIVTGITNLAMERIPLCNVGP